MTAFINSFGVHKIFRILMTLTLLSGMSGQPSLHVHSGIGLNDNALFLFGAREYVGQLWKRQIAGVG
jgi:hypothetical protein